MNHPDWQLLAEKAALYLYPRRCPFCGAVLGRDAVQGTVCPACFEAADKRLVHLPPRLPETEHAFYALNSAVAAYYYSGEVPPMRFWPASAAGNCGVPGSWPTAWPY